MPDQVCIEHVRWVVNGQCLGKHQRYDAPDHYCRISEAPKAILYLKEFHAGQVRDPNWIRALEEEVGYKVVPSGSYVT